MALKLQIWSHRLQAIKLNNKSINLIYATKFCERDNENLQIIKIKHEPRFSLSSSAVPNLKNVQKIEFSKAYSKNAIP